MERLIKDAEILDSSFVAARNTNGDLAMSYSDIVDAIHIVQNNMGITGTTAKEASTTIEGSIKSAKAAWKNLLTGLGDDSADFESLVDNLVDSVVTAGGNIIPRVQKIMQGLGKLVTEGTTRIFPVVINTIVSNLPAIVQGGTELLLALVIGIANAIPQLIAAVPQIVKAIVNTLKANWPKIKAAGIQLLSSLMIGMADGLAATLGLIVDVAEKVWTAVKDKTTKIWDNIKTYVSGVWDKLKANASKTWNNIKKATLDTFTEIKKDGVEIWEALKTGVSNAITKIKTFASETWDKVKTAASDTWTSIKDTASAAWNLVKDAIVGVANSIKDSALDAWNALKTNTSSAWDSMKNAASTAWNSIKTTASSIWNSIKDSIVGIADKVKSGVGEAWASLSGTISRTINAIKSTVQGLVDKFADVKQFVGDAVNWLKGVFDGWSWTLPSIDSSGLDGELQGIVDKIKGAFSGIGGGSSGSSGTVKKKKHATAYNMPFMFTEPTAMHIFGDRSGGEIVYGRNSLLNDIKTAMKSVSGKSEISINIYPQPGQDEAEIAKAVQRELVRWSKQRKAAMA